MRFKSKSDFLSHSYLRDALDYDALTGIFTWKIRPRNHFPSEKGWRIFNTVFAERSAFATDDGHGYRQGRINGRIISTHRLAWFFTHGEWPVAIDHINGDTSDNRMTNLRNVTNAENCRNQKRRCTNTSGVTGVTWDKKAGSWAAQIYSGGRNIFLGYFPTVEQAACIRKNAEIFHGYHPNHGRSAPVQYGK